MKFPSDRCMISLAALDNAAEGKATSDGRQFAEVQLTDDQLGLWEIAPAELDTLEAEGWVELLPPAEDEDDDRPRVAVTQRGRYALTKWLRSNRRRIPHLTREFCGAARRVVTSPASGAGANPSPSWQSGRRPA